MAHPAVELFKEFTGFKLPVGVVDSLGSGHVFLFGSRNSSGKVSVSGYAGGWKWATRAMNLLAKNRLAKNPLANTTRNGTIAVHNPALRPG
jgi:hypothetical protein